VLDSKEKSAEEFRIYIGADKKTKWGTMNEKKTKKKVRKKARKKTSWT